MTSSRENSFGTPTISIPVSHRDETMLSSTILGTQIIQLSITRRRRSAIERPLFLLLPSVLLSLVRKIGSSALLSWIFISKLSITIFGKLGSLPELYRSSKQQLPTSHRDSINIKPLTLSCLASRNSLLESRTQLDG